MATWVRMAALLLSPPLLSASSPFSHLSSLQQLNSFMETFFARRDTLSEAEWTARLPSAAEKQEVIMLMQTLMMQKNLRNCGPSLLQFYQPLDKSLTLTPFLNTYCVVHEPIPSSTNAIFPRLFGYVVLRPATPTVKNLHHSASHFESDGAVCRQAAVLFDKSGSRSLVVNANSRFAVRGHSDSSCQPGNTAADASHDTSLMFHSFNEGIWQAVRNSISSTFIQWHGMAETSCTASTAFISLGASGSSSIYNDNSNIANRLAYCFNSLGNSSMHASTPRSDSHCSLVAASNVFGRLIHAVPAERVCSQAATTVNERFIHIEQKMVAREALDLWTNILNSVFV